MGCGFDPTNCAYGSRCAQPDISLRIASLPNCSVHSLLWLEISCWLFHSGRRSANALQTALLSLSQWCDVIFMHMLAKGGKQSSKHCMTGPGVMSQSQRP